MVILLPYFPKGLAFIRIHVKKKKKKDVPKEYPTMHTLKPTTHKAKTVTSDNVNKLGDSFLSKGTCVINSKKKKGGK